MRTKSLTPRVFIYALLTYLLCVPNTQAKVVSESQAAKIAERLMPVKGKKLTRKRLAKAGVSDETPLPYYIFTGNDGKGFVIISADDVARPILGYSADAELTPDGNLPVPMELWLTSIGNQIKQAQENGEEQTATVAEQWMEAGVGNTVVQLQTAEWGQGTPFNDYCPFDQNQESLTGCVPTAYAILMKYYNYPQAGRGSTVNYVTPTQGIYVAERSLEHNYDWDNMPLKYVSEQYNTTQATNVATLLADIGAALQVDYTNYNTTGHLGRGALLKNFDYFPGTTKLKDAFSAEEWNEMLQMELDKERPVIYRADNTNGGGHAFMLDGYTDEGYFSINWGWGGNYNGLFALDALTPGDDNYNSGQVAYLNTVPMPMNDAVFVVEMNGQEYPTLTAAIDDAPQDNKLTTINLLADIQAESLNIPNGKNITLNIGNHYIDTQFGFKNFGRLTMKGTEESLVTVRGNASVFDNYATLNIAGGTYNNISPIIGEHEYRRCIWTKQGSETIIRNATFESPCQVVCTNGDMTIESGTFTGAGNHEVVANYNTVGTLTINGGTFQNRCPQVDGMDYRRCVWTKQGSETIIRNATFESSYQVVCTNGKMTIESGTYTCTGNSSAISNYNTTSTVAIIDGTFVNTCPSFDGSDYRRCVWTTAGSETKISKGDFQSMSEVVCTNGRMTIESGTFTSTGNTAVISNYNTTNAVVIIGGTFVNSCPSFNDTDYRRCVWTKQGSNTFIGHALFENQSGRQTLCFNGNATIIGADISNTMAYGCLAFSGARVVLNDCRLSAPSLFYVKESNITCGSGLFSAEVTPDFLAEGYECVANTQEETRYKYPYKVQEKPTGIASPSSHEKQNEERFYNTQGIPQPSLQKGVNIIRRSDGTTRKVLYK